MKHVIPAIVSFLIGFALSYIHRDIPCYRCNIVIITVDLLRADKLPCFGYGRNTAPNLCEFAHRSVSFSNAYSQSSWTLPSVMSFLTSRYPSQHGVFAPLYDVLPPYLPTLAHIVKNAGYDTIYVGEIDNSHVPLDKGFGRGFNTIVDHTESDWMKLITKLENAQKNPTFFYLHAYEVNWKYGIGLESFRFDQTFRPPSGLHDNPWLQYGLDPANQIHRAYVQNLYDEELYKVDQKMKLLLDALLQPSIANNTIVVIMSNHGDGLGEHGTFSHGGNLYSETTHVPLILSIPGVSPQRSYTLAQNIDIYPTLLAAIGVPSPKTAMGLNLMPLIQNAPAAIKNEFVIGELAPNPRLSSFRTKDWSFYLHADEGITSLYDLTSDPAEQHNVLSEFPSVADHMRKMLSKIQRRRNDL